MPSCSTNRGRQFGNIFCWSLPFFCDYPTGQSPGRSGLHHPATASQLPSAAATPVEEAQKGHQSTSCSSAAPSFFPPGTHPPSARAQGAKGEISAIPKTCRQFSLSGWLGLLNKNDQLRILSHQSHFQAGWVCKKLVHTDGSSSAPASGPCTPGAGTGTADAPVGKGLQEPLCQGLMWAQPQLCKHKITDRIRKLFRVV